MAPVFHPRQPLYDALLNTWGNRLRRDQISVDLRLLKEWVGYYW